MGNEGFFEVGLLDVSGQTASDPEVDLRAFRVRDGQQIFLRRGLKFPPSRRIKLPAFPQESNLYAELTPTRFRARKSDFFTLTDGETIRRSLTVFRLPNKWEASFTKWGRLQSEFQPLKDVLTVSAPIKIKQGPTLPTLAGPAYDTVSAKKEVLAKAAMLNLFAKLVSIEIPIAGPKRSWFSLVRRILVIDRERFVAVVDPEMGQIVKKIKDDIGSFPDYRHTPAGDHAANFPGEYSLLHVFSVKTQEKHGNLQLTLAEATDSTGQRALLLDTDMDENGELLAHLGDLFKHKVTGGTHPFDIHEYLLIASPKADLGYQLV